MSAIRDLVFDQYGQYELHDADLLRLVSGGHLVNVDPNNPEGNNCCYNSTCCNEFCVTVANTDLYCGPNPVPPVPPPPVNTSCWRPNIDCGCMWSC